MSAYFLENWKDYVSVDDYNYLNLFIQNIVNNQGNEKMILLVGPGSTGKTTLIRQMKEFLGNDKYSDYSLSFAINIIYQNEIKPLGIFNEFDETFTEKNSRTIINMIKYKQSFIGSTNEVSTFPANLLEHCRVIQMNHTF